MSVSSEKDNATEFLRSAGLQLPKCFYLWGAGNVGKRALAYLAPLNIINGIIDADRSKHGQTLYSIPIGSYDDAKPHLKDCGVIIAHFSPKETEEVLDKDGVVHWRLSDFLTIWYRAERAQNAIGFLDFPVTTRCTLSCAKCMQYIPCRIKEDIAVETLKRDLDALFNTIDFVGEISVIGGEPFLHEKLSGFVEYINENYRERIGSLVVTTNGTVMPDARALDVCHNVGVFISISDYSNAIAGMDEKLAAFEKTVTGAGVETERKRWNWNDPGRFDSEVGFEGCTQTHMQLLDGKLWRCTLMAAGCAAGYCKAVDGFDYYDLSVKTDDLHSFLEPFRSERTSQCRRCLYPRGVSIPSAVQRDV